MPKLKSSQKSRLQAFAKEFPCMKTDGTVLFCKICQHEVSSDKKFSITQNMKGIKHVNKENEAGQANLVQQFVAPALVQKNPADEYAMDLCKMFIAADIPLFKPRNEHVVAFLEKYTKKDLPSETTVRRNCATRVYEDTIVHIKKELANKHVWVSIDETTDSSQRFVANVVMGTLDEQRKRFLVNVVMLEKVNSFTVARLFDDSLKKMEIERDNVLLFVTDAAAYMVKTGKDLKILYPKLLHVTCLAHGLHRVCESIRSSYKTVDAFIANVKKVFLKSPYRKKLFREINPTIPLPPQPVTTRWGTWINAACYYEDHFESVVNVISMLKPEDASSIKDLQELIKDSSLKRDILSINPQYGFLSDLITKLQTQDLAMTEAIEIAAKAKLLCLIRPRT